MILGLRDVHENQISEVIVMTDQCHLMHKATKAWLLTIYLYQYLFYIPPTTPIYMDGVIGQKSGVVFIYGLMLV